MKKTTALFRSKELGRRGIILLFIDNLNGQTYKTVSSIWLIITSVNPTIMDGLLGT